MNLRHFPLSKSTIRQFLKSLFDLTPEVEAEPAFFSLANGYEVYYRKIIEGSRESNLIRTHRKIIELVKRVKVSSRAELELLLAKTLEPDETEDSDEIIADAISIGVRLLLMIATDGESTSISGGGRTISGETRLMWKSGKIKTLIDDHFVPQTSLQEKIKLDKVFNARNLQRIAGIKIRWTNNLADHLRMTENDTAVEVFHNAALLKLHQSCRVPLARWRAETLHTSSSPLFPPTFITETLQTLALLLPEFDKEVKEWFQEESKALVKKGKLPLDALARQNGQLKVEQRQIEAFQYWHDRLVILKQVFDEAEPKNLQQWWHDRRKRVQWYTFWIAALVLSLTIFFGLMQSIEGALQVYMAFKSSSPLH